MLDNLMVETFAEEVHLSVALNARLCFERLKRSADMDAHQNICEYVMIVGHAISDIPDLEAEYRQISSAGRALDDIFELVQAGSVPSEQRLAPILVGINAMDAVIGSGLVKTGKLYQAEKQVQEALRARQQAA